MVTGRKVCEYHRLLFHTHLLIILMQHRIRILLSFSCLFFFFQFLFLFIFMILLSSFFLLLLLNFVFLFFFFLSSSLFIIFRVAGLSAGPGRGDEVFLSCFPLLGVSLGVFSDGDCSYCFKYLVKLSSVCVILLSVCVDLLQVPGFTALA